LIITDELQDASDWKHGKAISNEKMYVQKVGRPNSCYRNLDGKETAT
jgi:hypothetical protein